MEKQELSPKVLAVYRATAELFMEGADLGTLTVAEITARAGIGKGTVYDYFANKEEMLAGALCYEVERVCRELYRRLQSKNNLYEKMEQILFDMERNMHEVGCAFKMLHLLMDNSQVSKQLRELLRRRKDREVPFFVLFRELVREELGEEGGISEEEMTYLVMDMVSRLICYVMYLNQDEAVRPFDSETMRARLCRDICRDVEEAVKR
ncbi:MAG: TetR/AcrR family transcriptional regulator [Lachnospiraceae bacterium]|nr:TetR/AcrR family transcriptional regulator [Lachnospiraceae bacterium]